MDVVMIYFYGKRFRFAPSFNNWYVGRKKSYGNLVAFNCMAAKTCWYVGTSTQHF